MISIVIDPATFRFVAQHLNHCATAVHVPLWGRVKRKVKCTLVQALRMRKGLTAHTGVEVQLYSSLTTALEGVRC
jgi:hypothetical protein